MRVSRRGAGVLALAALLLPVGAGARADELLVMPYSCSMAGGQPVLSPGPEQSHRIIGQRHQRKHTACSPANPDMCRHWIVHRFDLDCDGSPVSWVSVVAASNEGSRRAWLLDGRLVLRMGPRWSLTADDPCAREGDPDGRRMRRQCADRLALAPPPVVEMPFGYAPMFGIDGIFVTAAPGASAARQPQPPVAAAPPPPARAPAAEPQQPIPPSGAEPWAAEPVREPGVSEAPARVPPPPASAAVGGAQPPPAPSPRVAAAPAPPVPPLAAEAPKPAPAESKPAVNLGPRIVTPSSPAPPAAPDAAKPAAPAVNLGPRLVAPSPPPPVTSPPTPAAAQPAAANTTAPAPKVAAGPPPQPKEATRPSAPPNAAAEPQGDTVSVSLFSALRTTTAGALVAFTGLALGLLTAFALARRRERAHDARRRPRDLAAVSLGDKRAKAPARVADARGQLPPNAAASAMGREPGRNATAAAAPAWGDRMPCTRAEALEVLGMGVTASANHAAIKKIVDGLRLSWHPDHAKDEADRAVRELRSKQINAAWDLLRSQVAEV
jgi:hypothetical protein